MPQSDGNRMYCNEHVPRGCTCNVRNIEEDGEPETEDNVIWWTKQDYECHMGKYGDGEFMNDATMERQPDSFYYEILDEDGKRSPCCEYCYDAEGFEKDDYGTKD